MIAASGSSANCRARSMRRHVARVEPAVGGDQAVAGVDAQHQLAGILAAHVAEPFGVGQRRRADHQPRQAEVQQLANRLLVANAAAQLALDVDRCQDVLHARQIDGQALAGAVQIDEVQMPGALARRTAGPRRPGRRRRRFPAGSRPAAGGRTCRRADRSPARFAWNVVPSKSPAEPADWTSEEHKICHSAERYGKGRQRSDAQVAWRELLRRMQDADSMPVQSSDRPARSAASHRSHQLGEVLQQPQARRLALLRMELHGEQIVAPDARTERLRVLGLGRDRPTSSRGTT